MKLSWYLNIVLRKPATQEAVCLRTRAEYNRVRDLHLSGPDVGFNIATVLMNRIWVHKSLVSDLTFQLLIKNKINTSFWKNVSLPPCHKPQLAVLECPCLAHILGRAPSWFSQGGQRQKPVSQPCLGSQVALSPGAWWPLTSCSGPVLSYIDCGWLYFGIVKMEWGQFSWLRNSTSSLYSEQLFMASDVHQIFVYSIPL